MMKHLLNAMRLQAQRASAEDATVHIGKITNYDPNEYIAKAMLQIGPGSGVSGGLMTGWLPIASMWIGNGWGLFTPPNIGDMCTVAFINGDLNAGYIEGRFWNDEDRPLIVPSGEFWLVHQNGQFVKLTNDGKLTVSDGHGASVALNGDGTVSSSGTWTHTGDINVTGNISSTETITGSTDVIGGGKSLKTHVHGGVQSGGSDTTPPV
jgi:phage baseplate assembly protein V